MPKHGKRYLQAAAKVDQGRLYAPDEAIALLKETSFVKFDATIELHLRLGIDPRHADQNIRTTVALPHGTGRTVRVLASVRVMPCRLPSTLGLALPVAMN